MLPFPAKGQYGTSELKIADKIKKRKAARVYCLP
jgi:hypothetical protein